MSGEIEPPGIEPRVNPPPTQNPGLPGPQVGETYTDGTVVVTVTALGEKHALAKDPQGNEEKYPMVPVQEGGTFRPVVPPFLVPVNTMVYEYHIQAAEWGFWTNPTVASATGRAVLLKTNGTWGEMKRNPNGTWTEITPPKLI